MADVTKALEAKSDQLNAVDIMAAHRVIKIRKVVVKDGDQPISVFFDGDNDKPWKPCKGMSRILAAAWGQDSDNWIGKHAEIYFAPEVLWAGKAVGGVRIKALSDIKPEGLDLTLAISKQSRKAIKVPLLAIDVNPYPADQFDKAFPTMVKKMTSGEMNLQVVIAKCQETGALTPDQLKRLEDAAPEDEENGDVSHETDGEIQGPDGEILDGDDFPADR